LQCFGKIQKVSRVSLEKLWQTKFVC
jgi:hypothetical protein